MQSRDLLQVPSAREPYIYNRPAPLGELETSNNNTIGVGVDAETVHRDENNTALLNAPYQDLRDRAESALKQDDLRYSSASGLSDPNIHS